VSKIKTSMSTSLAWEITMASEGLSHFMLIVALSTAGYYISPFFGYNDTTFCDMEIFTPHYPVSENANGIHFPFDTMGICLA